VFRRRRSGGPDDASPEETPQVDEGLEAEGVEAAAEPELAARRERVGGPFDVSEAPDDGLTRLDLGGLRVPGADRMELRLELDEQSQSVQAVSIIHADSSMQLMAFAAPRTEGIWDDVREEIRKNLASQGLVDIVEGELGPELHATLTVADPQGRTAMQPVRFVGVDGPRWFVRALFSGRAARDREAAAPLEAVLRATVVVRGGDPMAPGDPLPLHVPDALPQGMSRTDVPDERPPLTMPERGPEITEIR
jgi:hypothetical protein